ncbi:MAG: RNA polymerase sigma factor [Candidatus Wildermuthbacteria bacterium]|nr:RNA polymerase sigma factor [Candidatus Wildermuthbacteria bacterium]
MEKEFLEAYEKYADALFRYCYFRLSDEEKAKDVVQDTFVKTWDYIAQGKSIAEMRAFLYRVASNCIVDQYRKRKTTSLNYLQEKGFEPRLDIREKLETEIEAKEVIEVLQQLDEKYRDAFIMRYVGELSVKEIAEILGEAENTVSVHIHRAVKQVRLLLKHEG